jgi:tRNA modification GTPase
MTPPASPCNGSDAPASALAVLTPPGRGGIAVIRCIGAAAKAALATCFRTASQGLFPSPGTLAYGHILDDEGQPIDEVILYRAGAEAFEVNCHGGPAAVQALCRRLTSLGLQAVDADRLMELEGLPLLVRQARRALRGATTPLAGRILLDQLNGALANALQQSRDDLAAGREAEARTRLEELIGRWFTCGRFLAMPPRLAIAGRPNAGKSTLLNRLAGTERAITSPAPGTTRDTVEAEATIDGVPVVLIDTAGLREADGEIERRGVERAWTELAHAALVLYLVDVTAPPAPDDEVALAGLGSRGIIAWTKVDTLAAATSNAAATAQAGLAISAVTGAGLAALAAEILRRLGWRRPPDGAAVPFTADQVRALDAARASLAAGRLDETERLLTDLLA